MRRTFFHFKEPLVNEKLNGYWRFFMKTSTPVKNLYFLECIYTMHDFIISILESRPSSWQSLMCEFYMI